MFHFNRYGIFNEIIFIILLLFVFLYSLFVQINILPIFPWLIIKIENLDNFYLVIFQIQATISTLGIAFVSLISGFISKKYYGISVTDFVLNLNPKILKNRFLIIINLLFVLTSFYFCSIRLYNLVSAIFICSVLICIRMIFEIYKAYGLGYRIKDKILQYIENIIDLKKTSYKQDEDLSDIFYNVSRDLDASIITDDYQTVRDDIEIANKVLDKRSSLLWEYNEKLFRIEYPHIINDFRYATSRLLISNNEKYLSLYIQNLVNFYWNFIFKKIHIYIWDDIAKIFFYNITMIDPSTLFENISELREAIYENLTEDPETWENAINFLPDFYIALSNNKYYAQLTRPLRQKTWIEYVKYDTVNNSDYCHTTETRFLTEPRKEELNKLLKLIIVDNDFDILSVIFPFSSLDYININLSCTAYLYCLLNKPSIKVEIKQQYFSMLSNNGDDFYYRYISRDKRRLLERCEKIIYYKKGKRNYNNTPLYLDFLVELDFYEKEFIFYYILCHVKRLDNDEMEEVLNCFIGDEENKMNLYNCFFFEGNKEKFFKRYDKFLETTLGHFSFREDKICEKAFGFCQNYFSDIKTTSES